MSQAGNHSYYETTTAVHGRAIRGLLGQRLRTMYDELVTEGVPEHFVNLLRSLDHRGTKENAHGHGQS